MNKTMKKFGFRTTGKSIWAMLISAVLVLCVFMPTAAVPVHAESASGTKMYRLYNPNSGEHFYTGNSGERLNLIILGWKDEGIGWIAPDSGDPVFRMYNANGGEHHYTTSEEERDTLVSLGWNFEGVGWYSDVNHTVPLYRQYNPNAFACNHNYTTSKEENDWLATIGWNAEGISWYGIAGGSMESLEDDTASNAIEADVTLNGSGRGAHAKLVILSDGGATAASFGIQYNSDGYPNANPAATDKETFLVENIYDPVKANVPGNDGKEYIYSGNPSMNQKYRIRISYEGDGILKAYVNGQIVSITNKCTLSGPFTFQCEGSGMENGDTVDATFENVRVKSITGIVGNWAKSEEYGLKAEISSGTVINDVNSLFYTHGNPTYGTTMHMSGTVSLPAGENWDTKIVSSYARIQTH
jgi:hypothetical protein